MSFQQAAAVAAKSESEGSAHTIESLVPKSVHFISTNKVSSFSSRTNWPGKEDY
jgi:hypothetical protein